MTLYADTKKTCKVKNVFLKIESKILLIQKYINSFVFFTFK